jgi:hypothetical protein
MENNTITLETTIKMEKYEIESDTEQLDGFVERMNLWLEDGVVSFDEDYIMDSREVNGKRFVLLEDTSQWCRVDKGEGFVVTKEYGQKKGYTIFKMRADCDEDVIRAMKVLNTLMLPLPGVRDYTITWGWKDGGRVPEVVCTFTTMWIQSIGNVRRALMRVADGEVMCETVEAEQYYDGKRRKQPLTP